MGISQVRINIQLCQLEQKLCKKKKHQVQYKMVKKNAKIYLGPKKYIYLFVYKYNRQNS